MRCAEVLTMVGERLSGFPDSRREAGEVIAAVLGERRSWPYAHSEETLDDSQVASVLAAAERRARGMPLAYATGFADFRSLRLTVRPGVLIPRPETEQLVEHVLRRVAGRSGLVAADIGTGSGAIAIALATEYPFAKVYATDISADAIAIARDNVERHRADLRCDVVLLEGDLLEPLGEAVDVLVSNPPYIATVERAQLPASVRDWEPSTALFSDASGLGHTTRIVDGAAAHLRAHGLLALEVDERRAQAVLRYTASLPAMRGATVVRDLAERDRFVFAERVPFASDGG